MSVINTKALAKLESRLLDYLEDANTAATPMIGLPYGVFKSQVLVHGSSLGTIAEINLAFVRALLEAPSIVKSYGYWRITEVGEGLYILVRLAEDTKIYDVNQGEVVPARHLYDELDL